MLKQPVLIPVNESEFILLENYRYIGEQNGERFRIIIFRGFNTDIASVPRLCWTLTGIKPDGLQRAAAVVHDLLYQWRGLPQSPAGAIQFFRNGEWRNSETRWTRKQCDVLFRRMMEEAGESAWRIRAMFWAVRIFGGAAWNH